MSTSPNFAVGTGGAGSASIAVLAGTWSSNQWTQGTVHITSTPGDYHGIEMHLRMTVCGGPSWCGYDFICSVSSQTQYVQIASRDANGGYHYIYNSDTAHGCVDGDVFQASAQGSSLTVSIIRGGATYFTLTVSDSTWSSGAPGMGTFNSDGTNSTFGFSTFSAGDEFYFAHAAAGLMNGFDCANAYAWDDVTTGINVAAYWVPGATLHLCDEILVPTRTIGITSAGSGTSARPVTVKFETGAALKSTNWDEAIEIDHDYITIDGGTNGLIQNTLNGTPGGLCPGGACAVQADSTGIALGNTTGVVIKNLAITDLYERTSTTDENAYGIAISSFNHRADQLTLDSLKLCDAATAMFYDVINGAALTNLVIRNSEICHVNSGVVIAAGNGSSGSLNGFAIYGNRFHDFSTWNDPSPPYNFHHDGIHVWVTNYGVGEIVTGGQIYNNEFYGDLGSGTAWIYWENYAGTTQTVQIFDNLWHTQVSTCLFSCGPNAIELQDDASAGSVTQAGIYNNTMIGGEVSGISLRGSLVQADIRNNTLQGFAHLITAASVCPSFSDYNNFYLAGSDINSESFDAWQQTCGVDAHSQTNNPLLSVTYQPLAGSPLAGAGQNLTSLSIIALDSDKAGVARPAGATMWDVGAYQAIAVSTSQAATPTFNPVAGTYSTTRSVAVTISCSTPLSTIYYTLDGSTPTHNSSIYSGSLGITATTTINAICVASGFTDSSVASGAYTINRKHLVVISE